MTSLMIWKNLSFLLLRSSKKKKSVFFKASVRFNKEDMAYFWASNKKP